MHERTSQIALRLPARLRSEVERFAAAEQRSVANALRLLISEAIGRRAADTEPRQAA